MGVGDACGIIIVVYLQSGIHSFQKSSEYINNML